MALLSASATNSFDSACCPDRARCLRGRAAVPWVGWRARPRQRRKRAGACTRISFWSPPRDLLLQVRRGIRQVRTDPLRPAGRDQERILDEERLIARCQPRLIADDVARAECATAGTRQSSR